MLVRLVQFLKALSPMLVTLSGIVMLVMLMHPSTAPSPMLLTPSGLVLLVRLVHLCTAPSRSLAPPSPPMSSSSPVPRASARGSRLCVRLCASLTLTVRFGMMFFRRSAFTRSLPSIRSWDAMPGYRAGPQPLDGVSHGRGGASRGHHDIARITPDR